MAFLFSRDTQVFPNLLSASIELLFQACDDSDADVRLMAGEALNKIIKVNTNTLHFKFFHYVLTDVI